MRYAIWTTGVDGVKVAEVGSKEEVIAWVQDHTQIIPHTHKRPRSTISFTVDQHYVAVELDAPGTDPA